MPPVDPRNQTIPPPTSAPAPAPSAPTGAQAAMPGLSDLLGLGTLGSQAGSMAAQITGQGQLGLNAAEYQYGSGVIGQNLQNQLGQSGIQSQQLGIQQSGVQDELGLAQQQYGLGQQSRGISGQGLAAQLAYSKYEQGRANQNALGSAAASGATSTVGTQRTLADIAQQYKYEQGGIQRSQQQLGITGQQAAVGYQQQTDALKRQAQSLSLSAKSLGLSETQMQQQATQALNQLGLSSVLSAGDIFNGIAQSQQGLATPLQPILDQVFSIIQGGQPSGAMP